MTPEQMNMILTVVSGLLTLGLGYLAVKYVKFRKTFEFFKTLIAVLDDYEITNEELKQLIDEGKALFSKDE